MKKFTKKNWIINNHTYIYLYVKANIQVLKMREFMKKKKEKIIRNLLKIREKNEKNEKKFYFLREDN